MIHYTVLINDYRGHEFTVHVNNLFRMFVRFC